MKFILVVFASVGEEFEKSLVLLVGDLAFGPGPKGFYRVDSLSIDSNREVNEVRVLLDDLLDFSFLDKLLLIFLDVHNDLGSSLEAIVIRFSDSESA